MKLQRSYVAIPIFLILFALGALLLHWAPERLFAQNETEVESTLPNVQFGLCFISSAEDHASPERYSRATSAGTSWNRYPFYWQNIETADGQFNYSAQDVAVRGDIQNGLYTLGILMGTSGVHATGGMAGPGPLVQQKLLPLWATGRVQAADLRIASAASAPSGLYEPVFADGTDVLAANKPVNANNPWARYVFETVRRYKPGGVLATAENWPAGRGISHWEIWNEPDWSFFWAGSVEQYYRLLQVAYLAAKSADPNCAVFIGGLATYFNPDWFPQLLNVMSADPRQAERTDYNHYFDAVAVHFYSRSKDALDHLQRISGLLSAHGLTKPLWVTESGVPVWNDYPGPQEDPKSPYRATVEEQAAYIVQSAAYSFYAGASVLFHFQLHDDCGNGPTARDAYGLFRNEANAPCYPSDAAARPSYRAYQTVIEQFRDLRPLWRQTPNNDHEIISFYRGTSGHRVTVMWATQGHDVQATVAAITTSATLLDPYGNAQKVDAQNGYYVVHLPHATNQNLPASDEFMIGGTPYILIEKGSYFAASELVYNGTFEQQMTGWEKMGSVVPLIAAQDCRSGIRCLLLGDDFQPDANPSLQGAGNSTVYQELLLDPSWLKPTLTFYYRLSTEEEESGQDWFEVIVIEMASDGTSTASYLIQPRTLYQTSDWTRASFDLTQWLGKRVRIVFNLYQSSAENPTLAWVDDVSIREKSNNIIFPMIMKNEAPALP